MLNNNDTCNTAKQKNLTRAAWPQLLLQKIRTNLTYVTCVVGTVDVVKYFKKTLAFVPSQRFPSRAPRNAAFLRSASLEALSILLVDAARAPRSKHNNTE